MIGYIENKTSEYWFNEINSWIENQIIKDSKFWSEKEFLEKSDKEYYSSIHKRINAKTSSINLFHFFTIISPK